MYYIYGICEKCGRTVSKEETRQTGTDTTDGISYRKVSSKVCGCGTPPKRIDIIGN